MVLYLRVHLPCLLVGNRHSRRGDETPQAPAEREGAAHDCAETDRRSFALSARNVSSNVLRLES